MVNQLPDRLFWGKMSNYEKGRNQSGWFFCEGENMIEQNDTKCWDGLERRKKERRRGKNQREISLPVDNDRRKSQRRSGIDRRKSQ